MCRCLLAIGGAYIAGIWTAITGVGELYFDAVGMFALFLLAGRYLERRARERTAAATAQLVNLLPASCLRLSADGQSERILLTELKVGDRVLVHPGVILPADGKIRWPVQHRRVPADRRVPAAAAPDWRCCHCGHPECGRRVDRRGHGAGPGHTPVRHRASARSRAKRKTTPGGNCRQGGAMVPAVPAADRRCRDRPGVVATRPVTGLLDCPRGDARGHPARAPCPSPP